MADENVVEEEVEYEEVVQPHKIETGDSVKVKQVLDDATIAAVIDAGYEADFAWENLKLLLMFLSCVCAMIAQFYPMPFPSSRVLLAVCCAGYFIISTVLQYIVTFVDKDTILFTKPSKGFEHAMRIRTAFPRFQEFFTLTVQFKNGKGTEQTTVGKMYVGKYFTSQGEFDEEGFSRDVKRNVEKFVAQKYGETEYNHKMD